ncbi:MAG: sigma-70 family RNA polymerase sigma factor [Gemmatimonadetes bacterium]|nr:sigma-70 family RNA polymerase sigma factor [Gemmatimonadota bacterium]
MGADADITALMEQWRAGDPMAEEAVFRGLYGELREIADRLLRGEAAGHTLQPTALVHEAYLRLGVSDSLPVNDRRHLLALSARVMRQVLIDSARRRRRAKRGGSARWVTLDPRWAGASSEPLDVEAFEEALVRLEALDPRKAELLQLRHLAGLPLVEIAELTGLSSSTVKRDLRWARAWIMTELESA